MRIRKRTWIFLAISIPLIIALISIAIFPPVGPGQTCQTKDPARDWLQARGYSTTCAGPSSQDRAMQPIDLVLFAQSKGWDPAGTLLSWLKGENVRVVYNQPGYFWWIYGQNFIYFTKGDIPQ